MTNKMIFLQPIDRDRLLDSGWSSSLSQIASHLVTVAAIAKGLFVTHLILLDNNLFFCSVRTGAFWAFL
jgi:hypothetical protein